MRESKQSGFTIVELLIVIVVIGILAAITIVAFNGVKDRANNSHVQSALSQAHKSLQLYASEHGSYPSTGGLNQPRVDINCPVSTTTRSEQWIPSLSSTSTLPQGDGRNTGVSGNKGCYMYASDGNYYILSAWNMVAGSPQKDTMYRRVGFREMSLTAQYYICNHTNIGGNSSGTYNVAADYYRYSYTISNITACNETPPAGA